MAATFGRALEGTRTRAVQRRRIERLETILSIADQWNQTNEMEPLLVQMAEAGRIRILATSNRQRSPFLPNVPTLREAGYDLVASGWYGMFAPAKTPPEVIARLNKAIVDAVRSPDVEQRFLAFGLQPTGTSAAAFADIQKDDSEKWAPAVKASGFRPEE